MKPRSIDENPFADLNLNLLQREVQDLHLSWTSLQLSRTFICHGLLASYPGLLSRYPGIKVLFFKEIYSTISGMSC